MKRVGGITLLLGVGVGRFLAPQRVQAKVCKDETSMLEGSKQALVELTAAVEAVDLPKHEVTLHISDGRSGTFKVRPDVDLLQVKPGANVFIRITAAAAIMLEKP